MIVLGRQRREYETFLRAQDKWPLVPLLVTTRDTALHSAPCLWAQPLTAAPAGNPPKPRGAAFSLSPIARLPNNGEGNDTHRLPPLQGRRVPRRGKESTRLSSIRKDAAGEPRPFRCTS